MNLITAFVLIPFTGLLLLPFLKVKGKGILSLILLAVNVALSGNMAVQSLIGETIVYTLPGSFITGPISIRIDALSGWFILIINLIFTTGGLYGYSYLKAYKSRSNSLS